MFKPLPPRHIAAHAQMHVWHWDPIRHKVRGRRLDSDRYRAIGAHQLVASVEVRVAVLGIGVGHPAIDRTSCEPVKLGIGRRKLEFYGNSKMISQKRRTKSGISKHVLFLFPPCIGMKIRPPINPAPARLMCGFQGVSDFRGDHHAKCTGCSGVEGVRLPSTISMSYLGRGWASKTGGKGLRAGCNRIAGEPYLDT